MVEMIQIWLPFLKLTNIASENWWLEDEFSFWKAYFKVQAVGFGGV